MRLINLWCLLTGMGVLLVTGCAGGGERTAEHELESAASRYIGPADRYDAKVSGLTSNSARQVRLTGYNVRPEPDIVLQNLVVTANNVRYQRNPFRITRVGSANFTVQVTENAVTHYLQRQASANRIPVRNPRVTFLRNQVRLSGNAVVEGQQVPVTTTGKLRAQGTQIVYIPSTITVEHSARGEQLRTALSRAPLVLIDLSRLNFEPQIQSIKVRPKVITVSGRANVNRLLEVQPAR